MSAAFETGLRQRKKDRLRTQLIERAIDLFIRQGFHETTIDEIVRSVDVSHRTFSRYFESKEAVVVEGTFSFATDMYELALAAPAEIGARDVARNVVREVVRRRESAPIGFAQARLMVETPEIAARLSAARNAWSRELAEGLAPRITGPDALLAARILATSAVQCMGVAFELWVEEGNARPLHVILESAFAIADRR